MIRDNLREKAGYEFLFLSVFMPYAHFQTVASWHFSDNRKVYYMNVGRQAGFCDHAHFSLRLRKRNVVQVHSLVKAASQGTASTHPVTSAPEDPTNKRFNRKGDFLPLLSRPSETQPALAVPGNLSGCSRLYHNILLS